MDRRYFPHSIRSLWLIGLLIIPSAGCTESAAREERPGLPTATELAAAATPKSTMLPAAAATPRSTGVMEQYWPTDGWRISTPEEQGMDSAVLTRMLEFVRQEDLNLHSLLIVRHGYIVSETYFGPGQDTLPQDVYSVTKSFVSTLIGIAVDRGLIEGVGDRALKYFPDAAFANMDSRKRGMTIEDLLTMRSGLEWTDSDADFHGIFQSDDWVKYVLDRPMTGTPGETFAYCSGCSHLLSAIFQKASGSNALDFAKENLFAPLGIANVEWYDDPDGISIGGWGIRMTPRNMAKLGYLYLRGGEWDGRRILSAAWVSEATRKHTPAKGELGYGYQWWTYGSWNAYMALGAYGQTIFIIPEQDLVIVTTARLVNHAPVFRLIEEYIYPAAQE